jgi:hypothetical protein
MKQLTATDKVTQQTSDTYNAMVRTENELKLIQLTAKKQNNEQSN